MAGIIKYLKTFNKKHTIIPVTSTQAVYHTDNKQLKSIIEDEMISYNGDSGDTIEDVEFENKNDADLLCGYPGSTFVTKEDLTTDPDVDTAIKNKFTDTTNNVNKLLTRMDTAENNVTSIKASLNEHNVSISNLSSSVDSCFQSVSNGKKLVANAITDGGVSTGIKDSFAAMAYNISMIDKDIAIKFINKIGYGSDKVKADKLIAIERGKTITGYIYLANSSDTLDSVCTMRGCLCAALADGIYDSTLTVTGYPSMPSIIFTSVTIVKTTNNNLPCLKYTLSVSENTNAAASIISWKMKVSGTWVTRYSLIVVY